MLHCMRLIVFVLVSTAMVGYGCNNRKSVAKQRKQQVEMKEERKAELREKLEDAKERHREMQSKETRKRMKKLRKKSERYKAGKKEPFWKRWFKKSPR